MGAISAMPPSALTGTLTCGIRMRSIQGATGALGGMGRHAVMAGLSLHGSVPTHVSSVP